MNAFPHLNAWLQCLWHLVPPRGLIHIGAGGGSAMQYPYASVPRLLAVEADVQHHTRLRAQLEGHPQCQLVQAVVAGEPGIASYHTLSQSNENGLCPATDLQALWSNINTVRSEPVDATTLQALLDIEPDGCAAFNWAVIDCLPAGVVLRGAGALPGAWDVVVVRALKDAPSAGDPATGGLSLPALRQQLSVFGLEYVAMEEENHPHMVRALFVRNSAQKLAQEKSKLIADCADLARARDELGLQRDVEARAKAEAVAQRDSLAQEKSKLIADCADLTRARDELGLQRDVEARAKVEAVAQRDSLAQEKSKLIADCADLARARDELGLQRDVEARAKAEAIAQRDSLAQEKSKLIADCADLTRARDELGLQRDVEARAKAEAIAQRDSLAQEKSKLIADCADLTRARDELGLNNLKRVQQLEAENQEHAARQQLMQEELIKAEAQIELIKDLLLREPGL